ncbi:MAG: hypothetical protein ACOYK8_04125 [Alphaproteobacteria bacterium]
MTQRFNIALLPVEEQLQSLITNLSIHYFSAIHDDYILGKEGLAHVTLCQFHAASAQEAMAAYQKFLPQPNINLSIEEFRIRPGTLVNSGKFIAEFKIEAQENLLFLQKNCCQHLEAHQLKALTPIASYSPHITMARLNHLTTEQPSLADLPQTQSILFRPALGLSTESGVFVREL